MGYRDRGNIIFGNWSRFIYIQIYEFCFTRYWKVHKPVWFGSSCFIYVSLPCSSKIKRTWKVQIFFLFIKFANIDSFILITTFLTRWHVSFGTVIAKEEAENTFFSSLKHDTLWKEKNSHSKLIFTDCCRIYNCVSYYG